MFIKNKLASYLNFNLAGKGVSLAPGGITIISDEQAEDDLLKVMIERGNVEEALPREAAAQEKKAVEKKAAAKEKKIPVRKFEEQTSEGTVIVKCAGVYKNGKHCGVNVSVPQAEFDSDTPYFCTRHEGENPDDYEKVDGEWSKKKKPAKRQRTKKVRDELVEEALESLTNVELENAIDSAKESPEEPKFTSKTTAKPRKKTTRKTSAKK